MLTIYAAVHRTHQSAYVVKQGQHSPSFDVPERIDSILAVINVRELRPAIEPIAAELEPVRAVPDLERNGSLGFRRVEVCES